MNLEVAIGKDSTPESTPYRITKKFPNQCDRSQTPGQSNAKINFGSQQTPKKVAPRSRSTPMSTVSGITSSTTHGHTKKKMIPGAPDMPISIDSDSSGKRFCKYIKYRFSLYRSTTYSSK